MEATLQHLTTEQLHDGLPFIRQSPKDYGVLKALVIRPRENERVVLHHVELSPEGGVHGDAWANGCWMTARS